MAKLMPFDELDNIRTILDAEFVTAKQEKRKPNPDEFWELIEDMYALSWVNGMDDAEDMLGQRASLDDEAFDREVNRKYDDETYKDRVRKYFEEENLESVIRVLDTDSHRIYNASVSNAGEQANRSGNTGTIRKRWYTMMDDRVRETHDYLEGMTVSLTDRFYTFDGDSALFPGDFADPSNNCNCRCWLSLVI